MYIGIFLGVLMLMVWNSPQFIEVKYLTRYNTDPNGAVVMTLANGLGSHLGFLKTQWVGVRPLQPPVSH